MNQEALIEASEEEILAWLPSEIHQKKACVR